MNSKIGPLKLTKLVKAGVFVTGLALFATLFTYGVNQANDTRAIVGEKQMPDTEQPKTTKVDSRMSDHSNISTMSKVYVPSVSMKAKSYPQARAHEVESKMELKRVNPGEKTNDENPRVPALILELNTALPHSRNQQN